MRISLIILNRYVKVVDMLQNLTNEKHTWRIIMSLYRDRLETEAKGDVDESMMVDITVSWRTCYIYDVFAHV